LETAYRIGVGIVGGLVMIAGLAMLLLPGPGWAAIFVGLAILSTEFDWAHRLTHRLRHIYQRAKARALDPRVRRRNQIVGTCAALLTAVVVAWYIWRYGFAMPFNLPA
jgi:uncharacterized protein (TIGR02611 family)